MCKGNGDNEHQKLFFRPHNFSLASQTHPALDQGGAYLWMWARAQYDYKNAKNFFATNSHFRQNKEVLDSSVIISTPTPEVVF